MTESAGPVRDIPLARYRQEVAPLAVTTVAPVADAPPVDVVAFERTLLALPLFFPITLDRHAFRDAFTIPGFYLEEIYDLLFQPDVAAGLAPRIDALRAAPPAERRTFVMGGSTNHYHWLLDFLPRLALLAHDPSWASATIITDDAHGPQRMEAIDLVRAAFGLPALDLRALAPGIAGLRNALMPTAMPRSTAIAIWRRVVAHHRPTGKASDRLFVRRGAVERRRLANEAEVAERLAGAGFTAIDPGAMSFAEQMHRFAAAAVVVGTHGAALANLAFMPAGGTLVEIVAEGAPTPFPALASAAGLTYGRIGVSVVGTTPAERLNADLTASMDLVDALIAKLAR